MTDKCVYCKCEISDGRAVSVCDKCGHKVWGNKMFNTIKNNMNNAREKGDLHQGSVCADLDGNIKDCKREGTFRIS